MKLKIKALEQKLGYEINTNMQAIGLDIAERTGICIITTDKTNAELDWQFIEFDKSDIHSVYKNMFNEFSKIISKEKNKDNVVIIEDTFLQRFGKFVQADVFKKLTRFGTLALAVCFKKNVNYHFILAKSSRAKLKIKMIKGKPKESVAKYLKDTFGIELDDNDISDCYDKETEVLTNNGWKYFKDLDKRHDKVLSMNLENTKVNYCDIKHIIKKHYKGEMYACNSSTCNFMVTPNHKMIIKTVQNIPKHIKENKKSNFERNKKGQFTKNFHIYWHHNKWKWQLTPIKDIMNTYFWMPRTCLWKGKKENKYVIPELKRIYKTQHKIKNQYDRCYNREFIWKKQEFTMNDWLQFLGWYISEGCVQYNRTKTKLNSVIITQTKDIQKINEIKKLLQRMHIKFNYLNNTFFQINNAQLAEHLSKICYKNNIYNCYNKIAPSFIKNLTTVQINIFLTAYNKGDGFIDSTGSRHYSTASKMLANNIQELIVKISKTSSLIIKKPCGVKRWHKNHYIQTKSLIYNITEYKYTDVRIAKKDIKKVQYNDMIYCVECNPHHTVLVRRNGRLFWSGNSIVLALLGICKNMDYRSQADIKKDKKIQNKP